MTCRLFHLVRNPNPALQAFNPRPMAGETHPSSVLLSILLTVSGLGDDAANLGHPQEDHVHQRPLEGAEAYTGCVYAAALLCHAAAALAPLVTAGNALISYILAV